MTLRAITIIFEYKQLSTVSCNDPSKWIMKNALQSLVKANFKPFDGKVDFRGSPLNRLPLLQIELNPSEAVLLGSETCSL